MRTLSILTFLIMTAGQVRAETPVGLDARGVDPMAAVDNRQGLDVRDALGRPVSARLVLDQLKRAEVARAAETAYTSTLPKAKAVLSALEYAAGGVLTLVRLVEADPDEAAWAALPSPRPKLSVLLVAVSGSEPVRAAPASRPRASLPALSSCRRCLEVLRC